MKKKSIILLLLFFVFLSCQKNNDEIVTEKVKVEKITDSVFTMLPGNLLLSSEFILWEDVLGTEGVLHILNKENGEEVKRIINIGQGPLEFSTPDISMLNNFKIFIGDRNTKKQAFFDLKNLKKGLLFISPDEENNIVARKIYIDSLTSVFLIPDSLNYIRVTHEGETEKLKNKIIEERINNGFEVFQGDIAFNHKNGKLVYVSYSFPYISIYQMKNSGFFQLQKEVKEQAKYSLSNNNLVFDDESKTGAMAMTLSKDYIVLLQFENENTYGRNYTIGNDFSKLPQTLFLYNYEGKLCRKIDVGMPVLRIASNSETNDLYFIGVSGEFTIYRCSL